LPTTTVFTAANAPVPEGKFIWGAAASFTGPQGPADASVDYTGARKPPATAERDESFPAR
jgi:hypothetical protein